MCGIWTPPHNTGREWVVNNNTLKPGIISLDCVFLIITVLTFKTCYLVSSIVFSHYKYTLVYIFPVNCILCYRDDQETSSDTSYQ